MDEEELPVIELSKKTDLIAADTYCPECGKSYRSHVPWVHINCSCGAKYKTDFRQDIYTKKAKEIEQKLSYKNGVKIVAYGLEYEADITLMHKHRIEQKCWDVSEIKTSTVTYKRCTKCGRCKDCHTCKKCGTAFTNDPNRRKQKCPKCNSTDLTATYFREVFQSKENPYIKLCPHCKSSNITMTWVEGDKCHLCKSKKLTDERAVMKYELEIRRMGGYLR